MTRATLTARASKTSPVTQHHAWSQPGQPTDQTATKSLFILLARSQHSPTLRAKLVHPKDIWFFKLDWKKEHDSNELYSSSYLWSNQSHENATWHVCIRKYTTRLWASPCCNIPPSAVIYYTRFECIALSKYWCVLEHVELYNVGLHALCEKMTSSFSQNQRVIDSGIQVLLGAYYLNMFCAMKS